ncbi:MAG: hypothetical protein KA210_08405 [Bacteroidia bacterium]|jgi:hypothetical protein|nr:hypothetical protein [Bacteroidia bacterium]
MKKIILTLFVTVCVSLFSQTGVCFNYHKSCSVKNSKNDKNWIYDTQSRSGLFNQGMTSKIRCVIYKGMDYRINVCCDASLGEKLSYKIFDSKSNELLYDNQTTENAPTFEFQSSTTRQLIIELTVPQGAAQKEKHKPIDAACVGLLIEHKVTEKQGF